MTVDGDVVYKYKDDDFSLPRGLYFDSGDNILVCGRVSHNVQVITADDKKNHIIWPRARQNQQIDQCAVGTAWASAVFTVRLKKDLVIGYPQSAWHRLRPYCADAHNFSMDAQVILLVLLCSASNLTEFETEHGNTFAIMCALRRLRSTCAVLPVLSLRSVSSYTITRALRRLRSICAFAQSDQSLLCVLWVAKDPNRFHADSENSNPTAHMRRLEVGKDGFFAGYICDFVGLSCSGSFVVYMTALLFTDNASVVSCWNI